MKFKDYADSWLKQRIKDYPKATTSSDAQRLRDYLLPALGEYDLKDIDFSLCKHILAKTTDPAHSPNPISSSTRDRVKSLLGALMSSAMNEYPPLITSNPVRDIRFSERRKGKKRPQTLDSRNECLRFIEAAKNNGWMDFIIASTFLMTGVRKQELIALRWGSVDLKAKVIEIKEKYEQASGQILRGTKAGENVTRSIPISAELVKILEEHKIKAQFHSATDFVLCGPKGEHLNAGQIYRVVKKACVRAKVKISPHGLRHSFGREFALRSGNMKALQALLGHSSSSTTDLYSDLAGKRVEGFGEIMSLSVAENDKK